jgi:hypothetical protein
MSAGETKQGLERGHRRTAAIEAEHKLVEVRPEVLAVNAVMSTSQPRLEVPEGLMESSTRSAGTIRPRRNN